MMSSGDRISSQHGNRTTGSFHLRLPGPAARLATSHARLSVADGLAPNAFATPSISRSTSAFMYTVSCEGDGTVLCASSDACSDGASASAFFHEFCDRRSSNASSHALSSTSDSDASVRVASVSASRATDLSSENTSSRLGPDLSTFGIVGEGGCCEEACPEAGCCEGAGFEEACPEAGCCEGAGFEEACPEVPARPASLGPDCPGSSTPSRRAIR